jgi:hypothetical protein
MCMCSKPNVNGQYGYQWNSQDAVGVFPVNPPEVERGDEILIDEPGRCGHLIDSHCLHIRVVKNGSGYYLLTNSSSGTHRLKLNGFFGVSVLTSMDSDSRYWMLQMIHHTSEIEARKATQEERRFWRQAAADNRIKTRKVRNENRVNVWVLNHDNGTLSRSLG